MFGANVMLRSVSIGLRSLTRQPYIRTGIIKKASPNHLKYFSTKAASISPKDRFKSPMILFSNYQTLVNSQTSMSCVQHIRTYATQFDKQKDRVEEISSNKLKNDQNEENNKNGSGNSVLNWFKKMSNQINEGVYRFSHGTELLGYNAIASIWITTRYLIGKSLIQRERRMLKQTGLDVLRGGLIYAAIIIPFAEFFVLVGFILYRFGLRQDVSHRRKALSYIVPSTLRLDQLNKRQIALEKIDPQFLEFVRKLQNGDAVDKIEWNKFVHDKNIFSEEFTLDALTRLQLEALCRLINVSAFGTDDILRMRIERFVHELKNNNVNKSISGWM